MEQENHRETEQGKPDGLLAADTSESRELLEGFGAGVNKLSPMELDRLMAVIRQSMAITYADGWRDGWDASAQANRDDAFLDYAPTGTAH